MKTFSKQFTALFACGVLGLTAGLAHAEDPVSTHHHPATRSTRIALPSENSAVNSHTSDPKARRNPSTGGPIGTETRAVTGTNIPTTYHRYGHSTDTAQPVYVIDRDDPRFSSRGTVAGALRQLPFANIGGH